MTDATTDVRPFWVDRDYDRSRASDGDSRYDHYVRARLDDFADAWDWDPETQDRATFASTAWYVANGPVMSPGYVAHSDRVLGSSVQRNGWDGSALAVVTIATGWPAALAGHGRTAPATRASWQQATGMRWQSWESEYRRRFLEPDEQQASKRPYLLASAQLSFPLDGAALPQLPERLPDAETVCRAAHDYVNELVRQLNAVLAPVVEALEGR